MATPDPTPRLDPLRGILSQPTVRNESQRSCMAAFRAAHRLALMCAGLFTALVAVTVLAPLGSAVEPVERWGLIAGSSAAAVGFWGIYGLTRYTLVKRAEAAWDSSRH